MFINPAAQRMCGVSESAALGRPVGEVFSISGPQCADLAEVIREAAIEGVAVGLDECELHGQGGRQIAIDDTLAPIRDENGRVTGVVIVFRDATQRRAHEEAQRRLNVELEERVQRRTAQLQAANEELEAFAYSIAHDLRAPLRAIIGFATRVVDNHSAALDAEGRRLLDVVASRAGQMSRMIDDYLRLSRFSHVSLHYQQLDMTQLAREAWSIVASEAKTPPDLALAELPPAMGDRELILQVWTNLLGNAVKFTRTAARPHVRVSATRDEHALRYVVEDNGVGFDPAYGSRLFHLFERLHSQREFEGSGVGLCIVQRVLHRHEGDIAISGRPGEGARVEFWLPLRAGAKEPT
jgi:PAS domain S-box-containing protein